MGWTRVVRTTTEKSWSLPACPCCGCKETHIETLRLLGDNWDKKPAFTKVGYRVGCLKSCFVTSLYETKELAVTVWKERTIKDKPKQHRDLKILEKCPFCGGLAAIETQELSLLEQIVTYPKKHKHWYVAICRDCGASGFPDETKEKATSWWNRRTV